MVDTNAFSELARSIVEKALPGELDLLPIELPPLLERLERGTRARASVAGRIEDQEFGPSDLFEAVKFLAVLVAAYKTILDIKDRRSKKAANAPLVSDADVIAVLRRRLADAGVESDLAARVQAHSGAEIAKLANS